MSRLSPRAQLAAAVRSVNARLAQLPSSKWPDLPGPKWVKLIARVDDLEADGRTDEAIEVAKKWEAEAIERIEQVLSEMDRRSVGDDSPQAPSVPDRGLPPHLYGFQDSWDSLNPHINRSLQELVAPLAGLAETGRLHLPTDKRSNMTDEQNAQPKSLEDMTVEDHLDAISKTRTTPLPTVREDEASIDDLWKAKKKPPEVRIISLAEIAELEKAGESDDTDPEVEADQQDDTDTDTTTDSETEQA